MVPVDARPDEHGPRAAEAPEADVHPHVRPPVTSRSSDGTPRRSPDLPDRRPRRLADDRRADVRGPFAIAAVTIAPRLKIGPFAPA